MLWGLFIAALWSPAGKGLTSWLSFVMLNCVFFTFPCGFLGQVWCLIVSIPDICPFLLLCCFCHMYTCVVTFQLLVLLWFRNERDCLRCNYSYLFIFDSPTPRLGQATILKDKVKMVLNPPNAPSRNQEQGYVECHFFSQLASLSDLIVT